MNGLPDAGTKPAPPARRRWRTLRAAVLLAALTLPVVGQSAPSEDAATPSAEPSVVVAPGKVVRWGGPGTTRCGLAGESWEPAGETCFYPLDLLAEAAAVTVERWAGDERRTARVRVGEYPYPVQHIELENDSQVHLSPADLERARRETARVEALWSLRTPRRFALPLGPPLAKLPAGGRFGARRFFNGEPRSPHSGADYAAPQGTPVLAVAPGRVVLAADHFFSGKSVFLDHGDGLLSMYFHLSGLAVAEGDEVDAGEIVGLVGTTGRATGAHLHFGLRWRGARIDPADLLRSPDRLPALGR
ncbi:MAG TPA: M23 family metallopeptidase [Thermoanaerobaculia bacterium]|nr:M23 family metallopeptidase [Thermoanaerobaculia bacterium]